MKLFSKGYNYGYDSLAWEFGFFLFLVQQFTKYGKVIY